MTTTRLLALVPVLMLLMVLPWFASADDPHPEYILGTNPDGFETHHYAITAQRHFFEQPWPWGCGGGEGGGGHTEQCTDSEDNDADSLIDCEDPDCWGGPACPGQPNCSNGLDDEEIPPDGHADCSDTQCKGDYDPDADFRFTLSAGPLPDDWPSRFPPYPFLDMVAGADRETTTPSSLVLGLGETGHEPRMTMTLNDPTSPDPDIVRLGLSTMDSSPHILMTHPNSSPGIPTFLLSSGDNYKSTLLLESLPTGGGTITLTASSDREIGGPDHHPNRLTLGSSGLSYYGNSDDHFVIGYGPHLVFTTPGGWSLPDRNSIHLRPRPFVDDAVKDIVLPANDGTVAVQARWPLVLGTTGPDDGVLSCPDCATGPGLVYTTIDTTLGTDPVADSSNDTLAMIGEGPITVSGADTGGDDSVTIDCPTCLTRTRPLTYTDEVTVINCTPAQRNSYGPPIPGLPMRPPVRSPAQFGFDPGCCDNTAGLEPPGSAFTGILFDGHGAGLECSYRVPLDYTPPTNCLSDSDCPEGRPCDPSTNTCGAADVRFAILGFGPGTTDLPEPTCSDDVAAIFVLSWKTFPPGSHIQGDWQPADSDGLLVFDVPCNTDRFMQDDFLAEAEISLRGPADTWPRPGELLLVQILRFDRGFFPGPLPEPWNSLPPDTYKEDSDTYMPYFLMNGRISYQVTIQFD